MPEEEAENRSLIPNLIGRGCGNANRLGVYHLAHDAAGAVSRAHQNRAKVQLLRGDFLQTAEQRIRRSVATGQGHAEPADISAEERKEPAGSSKCQSQHCIHSRVSRDVADTEHARHRNDRESQSNERFTENGEDPAESKPKQKPSHNCGEEATGASCGEPIKVKSRCLRSWLGYNRRSSRNLAVQVRPVPSRRTGAQLAISQNHLERRSRGLIKRALD